MSRSSRRRNLAGSGFLALGRRGEGEDAACPHRQRPADDALLAHADADHLVLAGGFLQELHHHDVVVEVGRGRNQLVEVRRILAHLRELLL